MSHVVDDFTREPERSWREWLRLVNLVGLFIGLASGLAGATVARRMIASGFASEGLVGIVSTGALLAFWRFARAAEKKGPPQSVETTVIAEVVVARPGQTTESVKATSDKEVR